MNFPTRSSHFNEWDCCEEPVEVLITDFGTAWKIKVENEEEKKEEFKIYKTNVAGSLFMPGEKDKVT